MGKHTISRYHDFCAGHRVSGHESKCAHLHGHNYRVTFHCTAPLLDDLGRVIDFSVVKSLLCEWLEFNWDHRMILWTGDPQAEYIRALDPKGVVLVDFNPTAENMARHLVDVVGPRNLAGTGVVLERCEVQETRKCSATYET